MDRRSRQRQRAIHVRLSEESGPPQELSTARERTGHVFKRAITPRAKRTIMGSGAVVVLSVIVVVNQKSLSVLHNFNDGAFDLSNYKPFRQLHPLYTSESVSSLQASSISCSLFTKRCWERINRLLQRSEFVDRCNFNTCNAKHFRRS